MILDRSAVAAGSTNKNGFYITCLSILSVQRPCLGPNDVIVPILYNIFNYNIFFNLSRAVTGFYPHDCKRFSSTHFFIRVIWHSNFT